MQTQTTQLRPDVEQVVTDYAVTSIMHDADKWEGYEQAKAAISRQCGWDAPPDRRDQGQYDEAISRYLRLVEL